MGLGRDVGGGAALGERRPQQDRFPFPSAPLPRRPRKGSPSSHRGPWAAGDQKWAARNAIFPLLLVETGHISLHRLNVFKLICLLVCRVINELIGNLVGHLYFFLMFRYPMDLGGRNFLSTPQFL